MLFRLGLLASLIACSGKGETTASGSVGGRELNVDAAFWGGPFVVLSDLPSDCLEMGWVSRYYQEEEPPMEDDMVALQFTLNGDELVEGIYDVAGEAALTVRFLAIEDGAFTIEKGRSGQLVVDEITGGDVLRGTYDITFDTGQVSGDLEIEWCTNLKG